MEGDEHRTGEEHRSHCGEAVDSSSETGEEVRLQHHLYPHALTSHAGF